MTRDHKPSTCTLACRRHVLVTTQSEYRRYRKRNQYPAAQPGSQAVR